MLYFLEVSYKKTPFVFVNNLIFELIGAPNIHNMRWDYIPFHDYYLKLVSPINYTKTSNVFILFGLNKS